MSETLAINGGNPVRKNFLPYSQQWIDEEDIKAVNDALKSDWITQGPKIVEFEKLVSKFCNVKYAVAFSSGTTALHAAAYSAGILKGDEAITSPITFAASANCVLYQGGNVVFADIKKDTYNIDPIEIKKKISSKTKVLIPVDYTGQPCDIDEINDIAEKNNLIVIEDASHAIGAEYKDKKVGGLSDLSVFSFHPVKHITTGEGGMVITNNKELFEKLQIFRTHGITKDPEKMKHNEGGWYYEMQHLGYNYRITDFQCALGISQFKKLNRFVKRRRDIVKKYNKAFDQSKEITIPYEKPDVKSSYHLYMIQLDFEMLKVNRRKIFDALRAENIGVHVHYIPVHLQPYYKQMFGYKKGDYPNAEEYYSNALTLPLFPKMKDSDVDDVINALDKVINFYRK
ncbi:MAG: UDP-4-amino-4,6-dideoxy-N-acetyl-beta-L-altrosamine transaminase [Thermoplasmatales archaeon]|nr:MAG: UDP-4-amino-4,6-dideoxy-N-acetyl-beta-L-altrosamine transaminase [Thermoplasmatales archaeon]